MLTGLHWLESNKRDLQQDKGWVSYFEQITVIFNDSAALLYLITNSKITFTQLLFKLSGKFRNDTVKVLGYYK